MESQGVRCRVGINGPRMEIPGHFNHFTEHFFLIFMKFTYRFSVTQAILALLESIVFHNKLHIKGFA